MPSPSPKIFFFAALFAILMLFGPCLSQESVIPYCDKSGTDASGQTICMRCMMGYGLTHGTNQCMKCSAGCVECYSNYQFCEKSHHSLTLSQTASNSCNAGEGCLQCDQDITKCERCDLTYRLDASTSRCMKCSSDCLECSNAQGSCTRCADAKLLYEGACYPCEDHCNKCGGTPQNKTCYSCEQRYELERNYCRSCMYKCLKCKRFDCEICEAGYRIESNMEGYQACRKLYLGFLSGDVFFLIIFICALIICIGLMVWFVCIPLCCRRRSTTRYDDTRDYANQDSFDTKLVNK